MRGACEEVCEKLRRERNVMAHSKEAQQAFSLTKVSVGYGAKTIVHDVDLTIPHGKVTTIIGPNGCGKSTLLGALAGINAYRGHIEIDGIPAKSLQRHERAQKVSLLAQAPSAPDGLTVAELVSRGRHPHQRWFSRWSPEDERAVEWALNKAGVWEFATLPLDELSGGQRQRAWIAMSLAQGSPIMLLDEPTTYLDIAHSVEVLRLVKELNRTQGATIVMVLHDLNLAIRSSDHLIVMKDGAVLASGAPTDVVSSELLAQAFDLDALIVSCPVTGGPLVIPR